MAGKKVFFPSTYNISYHAPTFDIHQKYLKTFGHGTRASMSMKRTRSQDTITAGRLKASIPAAKYMCIVCLPADTQVQYNPGLHGLCAYEEMPIQGNKKYMTGMYLI